MADHKGDHAPAEGEGKAPVLLEFLLLVWAVLALGYFYYTQGFLSLVEELWGQAFG